VYLLQIQICFCKADDSKYKHKLNLLGFLYALAASRTVSSKIWGEEGGGDRRTEKITRVV
jgi:hypothetical protein